MKKILFFFILTSFTYAQESDNWYFGFGAGLNFSTEPPTVLFDGQINQTEGCATISDNQGNLLFYTDGIRVWNKNHVIMPNGFDLMGSPTSAQSSIIVPFPGQNCTKYYIVTVDQRFGSNGVRYSLVDLTLDSGMGDIVGSQKNIHLYGTNTTESICIAKHSNGTDFWVIGKPVNTGEFYAYHVSSSGFNMVPVISNTPFVPDANWGSVKMSPNNQLLAACHNQNSSSGGGVYVFSFDDTTGLISLIFKDSDLAIRRWAYSVEFSPDNSLLYFTRVATDPSIYQYNINVADNTDFVNSRQVVGTTLNAGVNNEIIGTLQRASNGKIYVALMNSPSLGIINNPNILGAGCNYQDQAQDLGGGISRHGLPSFPTFLVNPSIVFSPAQYCSGETFTFPNTPVDGTWQNENDAIVLLPDNTISATYTFTPNTECSLSSDWTVTINSNITPTFTQVADICSGDSLSALPTTSDNGYTGTWFPALDNTATTTYTFTPTAGQCATTASMTITVNPNITPTFTQVADICSGDSLSALPTTSDNGYTGTWSPALDNTTTTTYSFTPDAGQCATTANMIITVNPNIEPTFTQVPSICSGDTLSALPTISDNGYTGTWSPELDNTTTTTYTFTPTTDQCATTASMTITVNPNITPTFIQVPSICSGDSLSALPTTSDNGYTGTWSPGLDNTATTTYTFTLDAGQCATTASMTITVNPNITPTFTQIADICSGDSLSALPTTSDNGYTGTWLPALDNTATTTYTFTPDAGQCATTASMTITVNPNITPTFTQIADICSGDTLSALPTTSDNGYTGTWFPALDNTATTTYTFTPTAGQCATTASMTITVNPNITPTFTQIADICSGDSLSALPTTSDNGYTGTWSPALDNTATTTYTFTPTAGQCATTASMTITVNELPATPTGNTVQNFCAIDNPKISDLVLITNEVNWYLEPNDGTILNPNYLLTDGLTLYAAAYDSVTLCESSTRLQVLINLNNPSLPILNSELSFCQETNPTIHSIYSQGIIMNWYDSQNNGNLIDDNYILQDGDILYGAALNLITGCESVNRVMVTISIIKTNLTYYNLISIDDAFNNSLKIENIEKFPENKMEIYNRYGTLVWKGINYNNVSRVFKGQANVSGVLSKDSYLPTGTYFFILNYPNNCRQSILKGFVHIDNKK